MTTSQAAPTPHDLDASVLIVGAGPTGLACAAELAHHGIDSLVVEPRETVSNLRPRAKTTSTRTMEHFRRWGVADAVRQAAPIPLSWSDTVTFCTSLSGREITSFKGAFGLTAERDDRFAESSHAIPQPVVETVLRKHVNGRREVTLDLGTALIDLDESDNHVLATVRGGNGDTRQIRARYLVGCDGPNSLVRDRIGATLVGHSDPRPNFNLVFSAPQLQTHLPSAVQYWVVGAETPGLIGRLDLDGTWWAILPGVERSYGEENLSRLISGLVGREVAHEVISTDPWTARMLIADRFQTDRVILAGEAAHLNPPWGGHGYNTSVGDAVNIGWKLAAVLQGWGGDQLLASYESERRPVVADTIALAQKNMGVLAGDLKADADMIRRTKGEEFYSFGLVLGYSYAGSPIVQGAEPSRNAPSSVSEYVPLATPGARLPHVWLSDGRSLYDVVGPAFTLIGPLAARQSEVSAFRARALERPPLPLTMLEAPPGRPWGEEFLLIRPDQHIAWGGDDLTGLDLDLVVGRGARGSAGAPRA